MLLFRTYLYCRKIIKMILRYLVLFGGIVMMITGCNSLVSQHFGTHSLHELTAAEATAEGVGDADYVLVSGLVPSDYVICLPVSGWLGDYYAISRPLLTPAQVAASVAGETIEVSIIGWFKSEYASCDVILNDPSMFEKRHIGLINAPNVVVGVEENLSSNNFKLREPVIYLQLGEKPLAWYWNLALMAGGILLALLPEARRYKQ
jgi:hypothetical protein